MWRRGCLGVGGIGNGAKWKVSKVECTSAPCRRKVVHDATHQWRAGDGLRRRLQFHLHLVGKRGISHLGHSVWAGAAAATHTAPAHCSRSLQL